MGQGQSQQQAPGAWPTAPNGATATQPVQKGALIAVCGMTGSGKSTFIQRLTGQQVKIGHNLHSETSSVQEVHCTLGQHEVTLVDTPGFDDSELSDTEVLTILTNWLQTSFIEGTRLSGIIYIHPITQVRMGNTSARNLKLFRKLCGDKNLGNVLLVTNRWEVCDKGTAERRFQELTSQGGFWGTLLDLGASAHRYHNDLAQAESLVRKLVAKKPVSLEVQRQLVEEKKSLIDTDVGSVVYQDIKRLEAQHQEELRQMRDRFREAQKRENQELKLQLTRQQDEATHELRLVQQSRAQLMEQVAKLQKQQQDWERRMEAMDSQRESDRRSHALQMAAIRRDEIEKQRQDNQQRELDRQWQAQIYQQQSLSQPPLAFVLCQHFTSDAITMMRESYRGMRYAKCVRCNQIIAFFQPPAPPFNCRCASCNWELVVHGFVF